MSETVCGSMFGPYEVVSELGRGSMAVVWRAYDPMLNRFVAIKEPLIPQFADERTVGEFKERFAREAQAVGKLDHPSIVPVYAAGVWDGRAGIVMQLVDGELLSTRIRRGGLPLGLAVSVIDELLGAVSYAHEQGVIHRDLKPENIFLANSGRIRLTDFGVAHIGFLPDRTTVGAMLGTPAYMAPEQMDGKAIDTRADLFSIGVIAYVLLTGHSPFQHEGDSVTAVIRNVTLEQPRLPIELNPGLPQHLSASVMKALEKNRANRFASAEEMRTAWNAREVLSAGTAERLVMPDSETIAEWAPLAENTLLEEPVAAQETLLETDEGDITLLEVSPEDELFAAISTTAHEERLAIDSMPVHQQPLATDSTPSVDSSARRRSVRWRRNLAIVTAGITLAAVASVAIDGYSKRLAPSTPTAAPGGSTLHVSREPTVTAAPPETKALAAAPTVLTVQASDSTISSGAKATIAALLTTETNHVSGATVVIEWSKDRKSWTKLARGKTSNGGYSYSWRPSSTGYFRAMFGGSDELQRSTSDARKLTVRTAPTTVSHIVTKTSKKPSQIKKTSSTSGDSKFVETR